MLDEIIELFRKATTREERIKLWNRYKVDVFNYLVLQIDEAYRKEKEGD